MVEPTKSRVWILHGLFSLKSSTPWFQCEPTVCNYCLKHVTWVTLKVISLRCCYSLLYYKPLGIAWFDTKYYMFGINMPCIVLTLGKTMIYPTWDLAFGTQSYELDNTHCMCYNFWRSKNTSSGSSGSYLTAHTYKTWLLHMLKSLLGWDHDIGHSFKTINGLGRYNQHNHISVWLLFQYNHVNYNEEVLIASECECVHCCLHRVRKSTLK